MRSALLVLGLLAVVPGVAADTDWDAIVISLLVLSAVLVFFAMIAAIIVACVCCRCCRPLQCCEACYAFNYDDGDSYGTEYTPERGYSPVQRRRRRSSHHSAPVDRQRRRSKSPRAWEGRNNPYQYTPRYKPTAPKPRRAPEAQHTEYVVTSSPQQVQAPVHTAPMITSGSLMPGQVMGAYPSPQPAYQGVQQMNAAALQNQPWFPQLQNIINQQ